MRANLRGSPRLVYAAYTVRTFSILNLMRMNIELMWSEHDLCCISFANSVIPILIESGAAENFLLSNYEWQQLASYAYFGQVARPLCNRKWRPLAVATWRYPIEMRTGYTRNIVDCKTHKQARLSHNYTNFGTSRNGHFNTNRFS